MHMYTKVRRTSCFWPWSWINASFDAAASCSNLAYRDAAPPPPRSAFTSSSYTHGRKSREPKHGPHMKMISMRRQPGCIHSRMKLRWEDAGKVESITAVCRKIFTNNLARRTLRDPAATLAFASLLFIWLRMSATFFVVSFTNCFLWVNSCESILNRVGFSSTNEIVSLRSSKSHPILFKLDSKSFSVYNHLFSWVFFLGGAKVQWCINVGYRLHISRVKNNKGRRRRHFRNGGVKRKGRGRKWNDGEIYYVNEGTDCS